MAFKFNPFTGKLDIAPARGATGATGFGATGATGLTGATGQTGQSSTFYNYQADTNQYSGVPTTGHLIWNNVTQTSATTIILSHIDALGNDIDVFFPLFKTNDTFVIQDKGNSNNFQTWSISATPTVVLNSYVSIPVTLVTSGGITQFSNNQQLLFAIVTSGLQGATGLTGATGATGIQGSQGATGATGPTITGTGVVKVVSGVYQNPATTIVNADVSATAAIDQSKLSLVDAAADGTTKGISAYTASDFNSAAGVISIDYTNGQSASGSTKGFLTSSDWTTFNNKQAAITTGSVDNAILRADGTGGATLQNSGLVVDDAIISFAITGVASTDIITATGHNFTANQGVMFPSLTGGFGLNTTTVYFVRDISGNDFKVSTSSGGAAVDFTTNITTGSVVAIQPNVNLAQNTAETNSSLVLSPKGTGALIAQKPNGFASGGNARGANAVDFQMARSNAAQVASGQNAGVFSGERNRASSVNDVCCGGYENSAGAGYSFVGSGYSNITRNESYCAVVCGEFNTAEDQYAFLGGGRYNLSSGDYAALCGGISNSITQNNGAILGGLNALSDRWAMQAHASGQFSAQGDAQRARFVLRCKTTTNSAVEMAMDGGATYLGIPSGKVIALTINISGVKSDGSAVAHYLRQYCVKNVGGVSSQVYAPVTIGTDNAAGTSIALSVNDPDDTLRIAVTGIAAETWRWVAAVDAVEIGYGT